MTDRLFGHLKARLNVAPLLLTPGIAGIGYAIHGQEGAWVGTAGWLAVVVGATVSGALHALRGGEADTLRRGRRAFDYGARKAGR